MPFAPFLTATLAMLVPLVAWAAEPNDERGIRALLAGIYSHYRDGATTYDPTGKIAPQVFTKEVVALLRENQKLAARKGDSALDSDPFCDCQDDPGTKIGIGAITVAGPADATAIVNLSFPNGKGAAITDPMTITFKREDGRWRVQDIVSGADHQSFIAYLQSENKALKTSKP